jgi:signal transduction histidine kinase
VVARTQRLQAIKQISQVISQSVSFDELLSVVGRQVSRIFSGPEHEAVQVATGLLNGMWLMVRIIADAATEDRLEHGTFKLEYPSPVGQVVWGSRPVILKNVDLRRIYRHEPSTENFGQNTLMIAPLITAGKTIGVIFVKGHRSDLFDEDDLETLESVAFQVASAIEYARLLRKTKEMAIVEERTRLARDMHDGVAQNLAYLLIQVDRGLNMVDEGGKLEQQLETIGSLLEQNIAEIRRNIFDLRPIEFEARTLTDVLKKFVIEFGERWNLQVSWQAQGEIDDVPAQIESSLYRILQEGLSNARQHARCRHVSVKLIVQNRQSVTLQIEDDGQGFDLDAQQADATGRGLGLVSMRERAQSVNGQLSIETLPNSGTRIVAKLPLAFGEKGFQKGYE